MSPLGMGTESVLMTSEKHWSLAYSDFGDLDLFLAVGIGELAACYEELVGGGDEDACFVGEGVGYVCE